MAARRDYPTQVAVRGARAPPSMAGGGVAGALGALMPGPEYVHIHNTSQRPVLVILGTQRYLKQLSSASLSAKGITLGVGFEVDQSSPPTQQQMLPVGKRSKFEFKGASVLLTVAYWSASRRTWCMIVGPDRQISHKSEFTVNNTHLQTPRAGLALPKPL